MRRQERGDHVTNERVRTKRFGGDIRARVVVDEFEGNRCLGFRGSRQLDRGAGLDLSPAAELLKRQATREDLPFERIIEAELLVMLAATLNEKLRWYPQTMLYAGYGRMFPLFRRATQHKHFKKLAIVTGVQTADVLRAKVKAGLERLKIDQWIDFSWHSSVSFWNAANMDKLDTLK